MARVDVATFISGAAQISVQGDTCDHPAKLMAEMARAALKDAGIENVAESVDGIACVEPLSWTYENLANEVARELGCREEVREFWVPAGGTSPQDLLHQMGIAMEAGEIDCAVILGSEAMRARRRAVREKRTLDWPARARGVDPMRGQGPFSSPLRSASWLEGADPRLPVV